MSSRLSIKKLDRFDWETVLDLKVSPEQEDFLPSNLYSIAQTHFEGNVPMGIFLEDQAIGFASYGIWSNVCWINRIMIDQKYQGKGHGSKALKMLLEQLRSNPEIREFRTSVAAKNKAALDFFKQHNFSTFAEPLENEIVLRLEQV